MCWYRFNATVQIIIFTFISLGCRNFCDARPTKTYRLPAGVRTVTVFVDRDGHVMVVGWSGEELRADILMVSHSIRRRVHLFSQFYPFLLAALKMRFWPLLLLVQMQDLYDFMAAGISTVVPCWLIRAVFCTVRRGFPSTLPSNALRINQSHCNEPSDWLVRWPAWRMDLHVASHFCPFPFSLSSQGEHH